MRKYTLLIDQDDVLAEYIQGVTDDYNKKYKTNISSEACVNWDLHLVFGDRVDTIMHSPDLFRRLKPVEGALEVFERLYKSNMFEMFIVTAANPICVPAKFEWIRKYMPYFPEENVIVCKKKDMVKGDFILDDGMHNIEDFYRAGGIPIIFDRPHNRGRGDGMHRVKSWYEFETLIMELVNENEEL